MLGILIEHTAGRWPLWLSPRQVMVCPLTDRHVEYADEVATCLRATGAFVDVDASGTTLQKKIRAAHVAQYNYVLVVGDAEAESRTVNVGAVPLSSLYQPATTLASMVATATDAAAQSAAAVAVAAGKTTNANLSSQHFSSA